MDTKSGNGGEDFYESTQYRRESEAGSSGDSLRDEFDSMGERVREAVDQLKSQAARKAEDLFAEQKGRAREKLATIASTLKENAEQLKSRNQQALGGYIEMAGERLQGMSDYVGSLDADRLVADVESFAKRRPLLVIGGSLALGFIAGRLIMAAMQSGREDEQADRLLPAEDSRTKPAPS